MRFNDGSVMRLYRQTIEDFSLYAGKELSATEFESLKDAAGMMSAKMRAVRIVAASAVSKKDLEQRLVSKGEAPEQARVAVQWMTELNLLDDKKTAEQIVQRCIHKEYGVARAKQALYEKRIPKEYWDEVLKDYPDQSSAIAVYLRDHLGNEPDDRQRRKVIDALIRKGHSYSLIRKAMESLSYQTDEFPED